MTHRAQIQASQVIKDPIAERQLPPHRRVKPLDRRLLTKAELEEIETRSDLDYINRRRLYPSQMRRALRDRELLLAHIRAMGVQP